MVTDRIKFSQEINMYGHHFWVSHEASLEANDNPVECTKQLAEQVNQFCKASEPVKQVKEPQPKLSIEQSTILAIQGCTVFDDGNGGGLVSFAKLSSNYPVVKAVYDLKKIQLNGDV